MLKMFTTILEQKVINDYDRNNNYKEYLTRYNKFSNIRKNILNV